jgi:prolyl oligopeptidase
MSPSSFSNAAHTDPEDPYAWLEDVQGKRALAWVREQNAMSSAQLKAHPSFEASRQRLREQLAAPQQIPHAYREGAFFFNFWRDETKPRGAWRRTPLAEYQLSHPMWEVLLDLDALAEAEGENWVWEGEQCLGGTSSRCLISLSRGGSDAVVVREFDTSTKQFVQDGFVLPEAKSSTAWLDHDHLLVGTDWGPESLTESGYPRTIKLWRRGQALGDAELVFGGESTDVDVRAYVDHTPGFERVSFERADSFYSTQLYLWSKDRALQEVPKPDDAELYFWQEHVLIQLRSDWTVQHAHGPCTWPAGSLLVGDAAAYLQGDRALSALFTPTPSTSLADFSTTRTHVLLSVLDHVAGRAEAWYLAGGRWCKRDIAAPGLGTLQLSGLHDPQVADDPLAEHYFLDYANFVTPDALYLGETSQDELVCIKTSPAFFDATRVQAEQHFATSKDGTPVPYFVVGAYDRPRDGKNPTLLCGYGGFEVSEQPRYAAEYGSEWLAKGGVWVVANIRGGGEYGPAWHQAGSGVHKQNSFDDFVAVAEDLIARRVTSAQHLGIQGGSNGGLLVGAVMVQRPELFNAVVCQVPLLDMRHYHTLLAGASWMAEYGDPDVPEDWAVISQYSPYHNVQQGHSYPPLLLVTSTQDDRVHPSHARKMAAKMLEQGHAVLYHETIDGGHSAAVEHNQDAERMAMEFAFLWTQLARP